MTIKIFNLVIEIQFDIKMYRTKRLTYSLPENANEVSLICKSTSKWVVRYYLGGMEEKLLVVYIDLPKCKAAKVVSITPMYMSEDGGYVVNTDRKIVIDIQY